MTSPEEFIYDNRTLLTHLQNFQTYTRAIPFNDYAGWDAIFFNDGQTPESLAALLEQATLAPGTLQPQQAFLLAFFKMMETPRRLMNTLPARHRELYFRGVLGVKPLHAVADRVLLQFTPDEQHETLNLPQGMRFSAGQDSAGNALHYQLDAPLLINHARITDIRWLWPEKAPESAAEKEAVAEDNILSVTACTVLDVAQGITPPAGGLRLFSPQVGGKRGQPQDQVLRNGRVVVIPELSSVSGSARTLVLTFESTPGASISGEVSVGADWHTLVFTGADTTFTAQLEDSLSPEAAEEYTFAAPSVRVYTEGYSQAAMPAVSEVVVSTDKATDVSVIASDGSERPAQNGGYLFGFAPSPGSSFTLNSPAWRHGRGQTLNLTLSPTWLDRPADLKAWYSNYPENPVSGNDVFKVSSDHLTPKEVSLFGSGSTDNALNFSRVLEGRENPLVVTLGNTDFQHAAYEKAFTEGKITEQNRLNPPYDPRLDSARLRYSLTAAPEQQFILLPYGYSDTFEAITTPQVYLGFTDVRPGQQLSLYWSLDTPIPFKPDGLVWEYLAQNGNTVEWKALNKQLSDDTGNFAGNGSGAATLPADAARNTRLMPQGRYWLRVKKFALTEHDVQLPVYMTQDMNETRIEDLKKQQPKIQAYPWLQGLWVNGQSATLINAATVAEQHFAAPLPAGTISAPLVPFSGLASVLQPLPGWGGAAQESDAASMQRIAEQVMHRGRASNWRDIVQLIIANFPDVHHVRLPGVKILDGLYIPPDQPTGRQSVDAEPMVTDRVQEVVVIPQVGINQGNDPAKPVFSPARLAAMRQFISERASPWLNLRVLNPCYVEVHVTYKVVSDASVNQENLHSQLDDMLRQHFMPWLNGQQRVQPGDKLTIHDIMQVLQQHPDVLYVEDVHFGGEDSEDRYKAIETTLAVIILKLPTDADASVKYPQPEESA